MNVHAQIREPNSCKQNAWSEVVEHIERGLSNGEGFELRNVRDCLNENITSGSNVTNKEVKVLLTSHFGDRIRFSLPKQVNRSLLFFSVSVTSESLAETIRTTDPIRQCAALIRQSLMEVDFDLQDRFCDTNDLKRAWNTTTIPESLLKFLATLFNFDINAFNACKANEEQQTEKEDEASSAEDLSGVSKSRVRQMHSIFQIMYHDLHRGRK